MFPLHPPSDPFLINTTLFGLPVAVRWYGVLIVGGAMVAGWVSARRAKRRGFDPEHIWNLLLLGMVLGIVGARLYYVAFEWQSFANRPLSANSTRRSASRCRCRAISSDDKSKRNVGRSAIGSGD